MALLLITLFAFAIAITGMPRVVWWMGHACNLRWGAWRTALVVSRLLRGPIFDQSLDPSATIEIPAWRGLLRTEEAVDRAVRLIPSLSGKPWVMRWHTTNIVVETLIWAGRYRNALAIESAWPAEEAAELLDSPFDQYALVQINLAEALYNLGSWDAAWVKLAPLDDSAKSNAVTHAGLRVQRAWIAAHQGRGAQAWEFLCGVRRRDFPAVYRSEYHYARAATLLVLGRAVEARDEVQDGLDVAKRPSSIRNGFFMRGRIELTLGNLEQAERWFWQGAAHPYHGQGGDGLLLWGDCLERQGRLEEARKAWELVLVCDPESESANSARARLVLDRHEVAS